MDAALRTQFMLLLHIVFFFPAFVFVPLSSSGVCSIPAFRVGMAALHSLSCHILSFLRDAFLVHGHGRNFVWRGVAWPSRAGRTDNSRNRPESTTENGQLGR